MYPWGLFGFNSTQPTREDTACLRKCDHGSENFSVLYTGSMLIREQGGQQRDGKSLFLKNQFWPNFTEWKTCMWLLPGEQQLTGYSEE